jgi:hypothetical protein
LGIDSACPPTPADHFSCYDVDEITQLPALTVSLVDQFVEEDEVRVLKPREICVPVDKNGEGIFNAQHHLVCYQLKAREIVDEHILVSNQFGSQELRVKGKVRRLNVPSSKRVLE